MERYNNDPHLAVSAWVYFIANEWSKEVAVEIFGKVMGEHFFNKWSGEGSPDERTMRLYFEMDAEYRKQLVEYACKYYTKNNWIQNQ